MKEETFLTVARAGLRGLALSTAGGLQGDLRGYIRFCEGESVGRQPQCGCRAEALSSQSRRHHVAHIFVGVIGQRWSSIKNRGPLLQWQQPPVDAEFQ